MENPEHKIKIHKPKPRPGETVEEWDERATAHERMMEEAERLIGKVLLEAFEDE